MKSADHIKSLGGFGGAAGGDVEFVERGDQHGRGGKAVAERGDDEDGERVAAGRRKLVMATNVAAGARAEAQPIACDGLRAPRATQRPALPPAKAARNGKTCISNEPLNEIIIRIAVATPTNRKNTVPRLTATAVRELE